MYLLGIAGQVHDASAALLKDGEIVAAAEEERFSRFKQMGMLQSGGLPHQSIRYCLEEAGITLQDVDHICYFFQPIRELFHQVKFDAKRLFKNPVLAAYYIFQKAEIFKAHLKTIGLMRPQMSKKAKVHYVEHHRAHAATCHFLSGVDESAVLIMDAAGEHASTSMYHAVGNKMTCLKSINYPHSLGMLYAQVTRFCGFTPWVDEYKVMGLASYGEPKYLDVFRDVIQLRPGGEYRLNMRYFNKNFKGPDLLGPLFYSAFGPARKKDEPVASKYMDIAASLQARLEEVALYIVEELYRLTQTPNLSLSGGVALNCAMNGKLHSQSSFKKIIVHNASGDNGTSLGAAA